MTPKQSEARKPVPQDRLMRSVPFHYGWVILASGALGSFMTTPGQTYGVSPFFDPVAHDLGLSRAAVATAYTIARWPVSSRPRSSDAGLTVADPEWRAC